LPPNFFARQLETLRRPAVLLRLATFALAAGLMWLVTGAGVPLPSFRSGDVPPRKIVARVDFQSRTSPTGKRTGGALPRLL
jgi:hypothetical protein